MHPQNINKVWAKYLQSRRNIRHTPNGESYKIDNNWVDQTRLAQITKTLIGDRERLSPFLRQSLTRIYNVLNEDTQYGHPIEEEQIRIINDAIKETRRSTRVGTNEIFCLAYNEIGLSTFVKTWANYFDKGAFDRTKAVSGEKVIELRQRYRAHVPGVLLNKASIDSKKRGYVREHFNCDTERFALSKLDRFVSLADPTVYSIENLVRLVPRTGQLI
jgi:hypothetical protein